MSRNTSTSHAENPWMRIRAELISGESRPMYNPAVTAASTPERPSASAGT